MNRLVSTGVLLFTLLLTANVLADVPQIINYQGRLTDSEGLPLEDGTYTISVSFYDAPTGGSQLWTSFSQSVPVTSGMFVMSLGSAPMLPIPESLFSDTSVYLSVRLGAAAEFLPRVRMTSVGYAFHAAKADSALTAVQTVYADTATFVSLVDWSVITNQPAIIGELGCQAGEIAVFDGLSWICVDIADHVHPPQSITPQGHTSGLDADKLDGLHSSAFAFYTHQHDMQDMTDINVPTPMDGEVLTYDAGLSKWVARGLVGEGFGWIDDGDVIRLSDSLDFVGVGRSAKINAAERFGIASAASGNNFGGMYISTPDLIGRPFYGYAAGGTVSAYHYYDGPTKGWRMYMGGVTRLVLDSIGNLGLGELNPSVKVHAVGDAAGVGRFTTPTVLGGTNIIHAEYTGGTSFVSANAVYGKSIPSFGYGYGGYFEGGASGVYAIAYPGSLDGAGISGTCPSGSASNRGVYGSAFGNTGTNYGVYGTASGASNSNYGVYGFGLSSLPGPGKLAVGVKGVAPQAAQSWAGHFNGHVYVDGDMAVLGNLAKASGSFKIDHPLDPANKYLVHSFVESPDMMNVYNGNVVLDSRGEAEVTLPDYFAVLNKDFRYQLTCIGGFAPVYIAQKISGNLFRIAGGTPGLEISWQVTGIRNDPYAQQHRIITEPLKEGIERGRYLHPELYGEDDSKFIQAEERQAASDAIKRAEENAETPDR